MKINRLVIVAALFAIAAGGLFWQTIHSAAGAFETHEEKLSDMELLGKRIFEDTRLSEPQGMSCASCHEAGKGFQGNNHSDIEAIAKGSRDGHFGKRNVPTLAYAMFSPAFHFAEEKNEKGEIEHTPTGGQFWDGRATDLATQVEGPLLDADEMNNPSKAAIVEKVKRAPYAALMQKVFGKDALADNDTAFMKIAAAVAAFENTGGFMPFSSKFDAVLQGKEQFTPLEEEGFRVFKDPQKGNCLACHAGKEDSRKPQDWLFTDFTYDNFGLPRNKAIPANTDLTHFDLGLCKQKDIEKKLPQSVTLESLCGAFKVPTLRNVALTAPYGHNGIFKDLHEIVSFYATRDTNPEKWYPLKADGSVDKFNDLPEKYHANINTSEVPYDRKKDETPRLNDKEIDAVVAFLKTLTDKKRP